MTEYYLFKEYGGWILGEFVDGYETRFKVIRGRNKFYTEVLGIWCQAADNRAVENISGDGVTHSGPYSLERVFQYLI